MRVFTFTIDDKMDLRIEAWNLKDAYTIVREAVNYKYKSIYLHSFVGYAS